MDVRLTPVEKRYEQIPFSDALFPVRILTDTGTHLSYDADDADTDEAGNRIIRWHEQLEILYLLEGTLFCQCDFRPYVCQAGDMVIVNPCETHSFSYIGEPARYHCLMIDLTFLGDREDATLGPYLAPLMDRKLRFHNVIPANETIHALLSEIISEYTARTPGYELVIRGDLMRLMGFLSRHETVSDETPRDGDRHRPVLPALKYISDHYTEEITLGVLAEACCMNRSYFCRRFHALTGRTAVTYINEYRLAKAKALLLATELSVSEIASATGFPDSSYFTRKFKELYGKPPRALRGKE